MTLKIHLIDKYDVDIREGETACGQPFFKTLTRQTPEGEYESYHRIGGLKAVEVDEFDGIMFEKNICKNCRTKYWNR